jgi:hypothetical protein
MAGMLYYRTCTLRLMQSTSKAIYQKCNVTVWEDQVALFELAMSTYGSVDVVVRTFDGLITRK